MNIYVLMCYDDDEPNDMPWKYFVDKDLADFWCEEYNKQARAEFEEDVDSYEEMRVHFYVEEQEIEETKNVNSLYGTTDVEPVQIDVTLGTELFKRVGW